jgi:hypothetical protein
MSGSPLCFLLTFLKTQICSSTSASWEMAVDKVQLDSDLDSKAASKDTFYLIIENGQVRTQQDHRCRDRTKRQKTHQEQTEMSQQDSDTSTTTVSPAGRGVRRATPRTHPETTCKGKDKSASCTRKPRNYNDIPYKDPKQAGSP